MGTDIIYATFMLIGIAFLTSFFCRNIALETIGNTGTNSRLFPKHFTQPPRWLRKFFRIKDRVIPKHLVFELYLSIFFAALGPLNLMIYLCSGCSSFVLGVLTMVHIGLLLANILFFFIMTAIFKSNKLRE